MPAASVSEPLPTDPEAIFVVGVARSGTSLMRSLLDSSDRIAIAHENHYMGYYFGKRGARHFFRRAGDLSDDAAVRRLVEMLYSGAYARHSLLRKPSRYWRWLVEEVPREELERRLLAGERTERGLFREFLRLYADMDGKPVMGEKTPMHLRHAHTLLDWFPGARVIHIMRDPRAIYVSDRYRRQVKGRPPFSWLAKLPLVLATWLLVQTVVPWRRALRRHRDLEKRYGERYMLIRFEDLVRNPGETVPKLSRFLGVEIAAERVSVPVTHGMRASEEGLDPTAADRWRERIHPIPRRIIELTLRGPMRKYGYTN